jgi:hypothetical protein
MNPATKIVTENAVDQWADMGFPDDYRAEAADLKDYYTRLMEDFCENYDEQWFALIATPAVQKTIDWEAVAEAVNNMLAENQDNGYCPLCNELTNTKNSCWSRTCCVCLEMTFCEDCVEDCEDKDCSHDWETHCICAKCASS